MPAYTNLSLPAKPWQIALVFVTAAALGFAGAMLWQPGPPAVTNPAQRQNPAVSRHLKSWQTDEFIHWVRQPADFSIDHSPGDELSDCSDDELRTALDQGLADPASMLTLSPASELLHRLLGTLTERNPAAALAWFESISSPTRQSELAGTLGAHWPPTRAAEGLDYVFKHRGLFETENGTSSGHLIRKAIEAAAARGPAAVAEVLGQLRDNRLTPRYTEGWKFPPGFDFAGLAATPEARSLGQGYGFFAGAWMSQNRDEAFTHLVASGDEKISIKGLFADLVPQNSAINHEAAAERAKWLAAKLGGLDAERRRQLALGGVEALADSPAAIAGFTVSLTNMTDRDAVARAAATRLLQEALEPSLAYLEAACDPAQRLDLLESIDVDQYRGWFPQGPSETQLREKLAAWNASPERIESILNHLRNRPR